MTSYDRYDLASTVVLWCIIATALLVDIQMAEKDVTEPRHAGECQRPDQERACMALIAFASQLGHEASSHSLCRPSVWDREFSVAYTIDGFGNEVRREGGQRTATRRERAAH